MRLSRKLGGLLAAAPMGAGVTAVAVPARRWVQRLTLKQYILFAAVVNFAAAAVVGAVASAITGAFSWPWVAVWTVLMTGFLTWWRRDGLRQGKEYPAGQSET